MNWPDHLPDGSILVVDESQELWPVRPSSKAVPPGLSALEKHRHRGVDIYFITQEPGLLDSHARKIANEHYHYIRPFSGPFIQEYHSGIGAISPSNRSDLRRCSVTKKRLPKKVFGLYISSELHTHKFSAPPILYLFAAVIIISGASWWFFFHDFSLGDADPVEQAVPGSPASKMRGGIPDGPVDWASISKPQLSSLPYSAPLYREQALTVKSAPVIHGCMSFRSDLSDCTCYTQQGTRIRDLPLPVCQRALEDGVFNHMVADADLGYPMPGNRQDGGAEGRSAPSGDAGYGQPGR
ncbi:zonular occludens toxin [Alcanivorax hongdengensis A-11-3]|uniref:Zonular occludens toxin n=1 Tax=Alcanivorax hongdengensis A-11-3 TaxID=1177179 RepID=L0WB11_9GAMM|nr:zonular occludens toxin [Alcanivorax hongdengensis A-11-3]